jgi:uncharacterized HAD superfamily protein/orotate phosphoribosyltransferase
VADLNRTVLSQLHRLPDDIDVVVGIPRSGMLPATLVSLHLNLPLSDIDGFLSGKIFRSGDTRRHPRLDVDLSHPRHALVIDDSALTGASLRSAQNRIAAAAGSHRVTYCIVYATHEFRQDAIVLEKIRGARVFEWNVLHHSIISKSCVDIDGVLCHDPTPVQNDDGSAYLEFIGSARPFQIPTKRIGWLVTNRLEKYRSATESWLRKVGVQYDHLIMLDLPDAETRRRLGVHALHKGQFYKSCPADLFVESELNQAQEIANISGKPVLSLDGPVMCLPNTMSVRSIREGSKRLAKRWTPTATKQVIKRLIGIRA